MSGTSGVSTAARQQQQAAQNFKPKSEWKHQEDASVLHVQLPGFQLEQFTLTPNYSNRTVRVEGKRRHPNGRLLSVDETFTIPEEYELSKMDRQYERGALMLKMPRKLVPQQPTVKERKDERTVGESMTGKDEGKFTTGWEKENPDEAATHRPAVTTTMKEKSALAAGKTDEEKMAERKDKNDDADGNPGKPESVVQNDGVKGATMTTGMSVANVDKKKENAKASDKNANEERTLIVNMGAALLIIVGLVVSLFYYLIRKTVG